ncbi:kinase-like protein [Massarina eburnea CBS 473.64]|uniref:non-specific serine/threonine protein kinase n=1 Tax=Massarina eburnea CBS 473.64 TaxID=1395130 RepID=A0A6A6RVG0_9PLEO|nr:kinase-like protein [Massarina eburnea CBS 473.64]
MQVNQNQPKSLTPRDLPADQDGYKFTHRLANQGFFNLGIYLVQNLSTQRQAICKMANPEDIPVQVEVSMQAKVSSHPNIVTLYDFVPPHKIYMEYCDSGNLFDLMCRYSDARKAVPEAFIWHVAEALMSVLCFLHSGIAHDDASLTRKEGWRPMCHNDIKVRNVLLTSVGAEGALYPRVMVADFGFAMFPSGAFAVDTGDLLDSLTLLKDLCEVAGKDLDKSMYSTELLSLVRKRWGLPGWLRSADRFLGSVRRARVAVVGRGLVCEPLLPLRN